MLAVQQYKAANVGFVSSTAAPRHSSATEAVKSQ
jgi:hypothetical protein